MGKSFVAFDANENRAYSTTGTIVPLVLVVTQPLRSYSWSLTFVGMHVSRFVDKSPDKLQIGDGSGIRKLLVFPTIMSNQNDVLCRTRRRCRRSRMNSVLTIAFVLAPAEFSYYASSFAFVPKLDVKQNMGIGRREFRLCEESTTRRTKETAILLWHSSDSTLMNDEIARSETHPDYILEGGSESKSDRPYCRDGELASKRRQFATRASFLSMKRSPNQTSSKTIDEDKRTSVGKRRIGSATVSRDSTSATNIIMDSIRKTALGTSSAKVFVQAQQPNKTNTDDKEKQSVSSVSQATIHSAIDELLRKHSPQECLPVWYDSKLTSAFETFGRTIGILGETAQRQIQNIRVRPGSVLLEPTGVDGIDVRVATPSDDVDIANLRLSVFSDFSPDLQSQFCSRSCQAIASRRMRGAACVVATVPRKGSQTSGCHARIILGTAECSFHEFVGTQLGRRRATNSLLYITEVAVNPYARRRGIGSKLLAAIDILARERSIESLYLHVDVTNHGALNMYHKCGYHEVISDHPMYLEFTTSLNLQPGATKGRDHYLLCRNLTTDPTWYEETRTFTQRPQLISTLGIEIPA